MLSRYLSRLDLTPMALLVGLAVSTSAHGNTILDTNGNPLPDDFGALIQLLNNSDQEKRQVLGLSAGSAAAATPRAQAPAKDEKTVDTSKADATSAEASPEAEPEAPKKNPAFYDVDLAKRLYDALDVGDAPRVKWMLQSGAGNVYTTEDNNTSLRLAITKGWASVVRVLLERDPDLKHESPGDVNLLHEATVKGSYDIAKMLIEAGIDPEAKTSKNWTNLHLAARYGHTDLIRYYLNLGLDPDARNSEGNTAHWLASHLRHYQAAGYLSSRTNVSSYQMFDDGKGGKKSRKSKKRTTTKRKTTPEFTPAQLQAILGQ